MLPGMTEPLVTLKNQSSEPNLAPYTAGPLWLFSSRVSPSVGLDGVPGWFLSALRPAVEHQVSLGSLS